MPKQTPSKKFRPLTEAEIKHVSGGTVEPKEEQTSRPKSSTKLHNKLL